MTWVARREYARPSRRVAGDPLRQRDRLGRSCQHAGNAGWMATSSSIRKPSSMRLKAPGPDKGFAGPRAAAGKPFHRDVDRVIANVGYTPDSELYRELQVHECYASLGR